MLLLGAGLPRRGTLTTDQSQEPLLLRLEVGTLGLGEQACLHPGGLGVRDRRPRAWFGVKAGGSGLLG